MLKTKLIKYANKKRNRVVIDYEYYRIADEKELEEIYEIIDGIDCIYNLCYSNTTKLEAKRRLKTDELTEIETNFYNETHRIVFVRFNSSNHLYYKVPIEDTEDFIKEFIKTWDLVDVNEILYPKSDDEEENEY